jgi:hypothetical protein
MKNIILILFSLPFCFCQNLLSQSSFVKIAGANNRAIYSQASSLTADSGIVNVGWDDNGNADLMKFNQFGMVEWSMYPSTIDSYLDCIHKFNQNLYAGGDLGNEAYLLSINSSGQKLWSKIIHYPSSTGSLISGITSDSNNLYLIGTVNLPTQNSTLFLTKMNSFGNIIWTKEIGIGYAGDLIFNKILNQIVFLANNNIVAADTSGNIIWSKSYSTSFGFSKIAIQQSNYIITGGTDSGGIVLSIDQNGNSNWAKQYTDSNFTYLYFNSVYISGDNSIYLSNITGSAGVNPPTSLFKLNDSGGILWCNTYWTGGSNGISGITHNYDGGLWLTGEAPFNYQNVFFISRDTSSALGCDAHAIYPHEFAFPVVDSVINISSTPINLPWANALDTLIPQSLTQFFDCPTSIVESNYADEIVLPFPNPTSGNITFQFSGDVSNTTIELFDPLGREVQNQKITDNYFTISIIGYSSGIYFYRIDKDGKIINTGKLIVE